MEFSNKLKKSILS